MLKITIVEDTAAIREELGTFLRSNGFEVIAIETFEDVVNQVLKTNPDCLLLDLNLPNVDGHYICREIRKTSSMPIIVVTSRNNDLDELMSLNLGADDFVSKPYNLQVLLAHINRLLERVNQHALSHTLEYKGIVVDTSRSMISFQGLSEELTKNEVKIMTYLFKNIGKIVSRDELVEFMWDDSMFVDDNTLTVNVNRLRKKLEQLGIASLIETKWGMGYIIHEYH